MAQMERDQASFHQARTALNRDPALRRWAEQYLKEKERAKRSDLNQEEFEKHWRYVIPERMHEGAVEAYQAHQETKPTNGGDEVS